MNSNHNEKPDDKGKKDNRLKKDAEQLFSFNPGLREDAAYTISAEEMNFKTPSKMEKNSTSCWKIYSGKSIFVLGKNDFELVGHQVLNVGRATGKRHTQNEFVNQIHKKK